jgi:hypothetical protein
MAYIKMRRFEEAEYDCSEAIDDFEFALRLEPENKELSKKIKFGECVTAIVTSTNYKDFQIFSQKSTATGGWSTEKGGVRGVESDHRNRGTVMQSSSEKQTNTDCLNMGNSTLSRLCKVVKRVQPLADLRELAETVEFFTLVYSNQNLQSLKGYLVFSFPRKHRLAIH